MFVLSGLVACGQSENEQTSTPVSGTKTPVDLVLTGGKVLTVDADFSIHDTVVVNDGRIVETGSAELLDRFEPAETVNLAGKTLMPGFIDSHTHIRGRPLRYIELGGVTSIVEIQELITAKIAEIGEAK